MYLYTCAIAYSITKHVTVRTCCINSGTIEPTSKVNLTKFPITAGSWKVREYPISAQLTKDLMWWLFHHFGVHVIFWTNPWMPTIRHFLGLTILWHKKTIGPLVPWFFRRPAPSMPSIRLECSTLSHSTFTSGGRASNSQKHLQSFKKLGLVSFAEPTNGIAKWIEPIGRRHEALDQSRSSKQNPNGFQTAPFRRWFKQLSRAQQSYRNLFGSL